MKTKYTELSQKLDHIINFAVDDDDYEDRRFPIKTATAGAVGTGAAGYGLYRRGLALGGSQTRGVTGNIMAGARALPSDVGTGAQRVAQRGSLLLHPEARGAAIHDIRSSLAKRVGKLAKYIRP